MTGTIRRNRKFLLQAFWGKFEVGEKKYFRKGPILAAAFPEKSRIFLCFSSPPTARQKIFNIFMYVMVNKNRLHRTCIKLQKFYWGN
jgi:hypothetical protein